MRLEAVHEVIHRAKAMESRSHHFQRLLDDQTRSFPDFIHVEGTPETRHMLEFVIDYIELAPPTLARIAESAQAAGVEDWFEPFLQVALNYLVHPSIILNQLTGLDGLMIRAYQCHRLVEELFDHNRILRNSKTYPMELTQANLIVHHLIGESFANEIDESIVLTLSRLVRVPHYYRLDLTRFLQQLNSPDWQDLRRRWQNLLTDHHIHFDLYRSIG